MKLGYFILGTSYSVVLSVMLLLALNPAQYEKSITAAMIAEYQHLYCSRDKTIEVPMQIGGAAALSRIIVNADLGLMAQALYVNCRPVATSHQATYKRHVQ